MQKYKIDRMGDLNLCKVSIALLTYNHKDYLEDAIESVLKQKVNFKYEIVIGDDCSTDGAVDIIERYKSKYPNIIKYNPNNSHVGIMQNELNMLNSCEGEYIAFLEGDDNWINENKLQMQVDFLDKNKDYSACYTDVKVIGDDILAIEEYNSRKYNKDINSFEEYFNYNPVMPTATVMFRNIVKEENIEKYYFISQYISDRIMFCLMLKYGKVKFLDSETAIYRYILHKKGSFSSMDIVWKHYDYVRSLRAQRMIAPKEYKYLVDQEIAFFQKLIMKIFLSRSNYLEFIKYFFIEVKFIERLKLLLYRREKIAWQK